ncbi:DUF4843 domain-containing protein [Desertivirga arenae]|uniref:DUF4843 domain-containing protein n=1 Tax=Desertivirga arenae TaxID=2810309 RepID=UPI001A97742C|nr:DUF4843 domain-containing protein [Pedobacter sp. SYSU D00823]
MKNLKLNILVTIVSVISLCACNKEVMTYENDPRVYFFERANDLVKTRLTFKSYSFLLLPSTVLQDTLKIKIKTMGLPATRDRIVRGEAISEGTTAVEGTHYRFIDGFVRAGQTEGTLNVLLLRTADIKSKTASLNLRIAETADFKPGVVEDNFFTVSWSDNLVKPSNWDAFIGLSTYFGAYSNVKYRFIIDVLGVANFPLQQSARVPLQPGEYSGAMMLDLKFRLKAALASYNATNPPLTDENGTAVTFPN